MKEKLCQGVCFTCAYWQEVVIQKQRSKCNSSNTLYERRDALFNKDRLIEVNKILQQFYKLSNLETISNVDLHLVQL